MAIETKNISDTLELFSSKVLVQKLKDYTILLENITSSTALSKVIVSDFIALTTYYQTVGDKMLENINEDLKENLENVYILHYAIPENFKEVFLLHRDVLLQLQIAINKKEDTSVSEIDLNNHFKNSLELLIKAVTFCVNYIEKECQSIKLSHYQKKTFNSLKHKKNPWEVYNKQFEDIKDQIKQVSNSALPVLKAMQTFSAINILTQETIGLSTEASLNLKSVMVKAIKSIDEMTSTNTISELIHWIDLTVVDSEKHNDFQVNYTKILEEKIKPLSRIIVPVSTENGVLLTRQIDFNKTVKKWFDFEIIPLLIDLWDQKATMESFFNHSLLNLKSSLLVEKSNDSLEAMHSQLKTLKNAHSTLTLNDSGIRAIANEITLKLEEKFKVTNLYSQEDFLEVSFQSSLSQFAYNQGNIFTALKKSILKKITSLNSKYENGLLFTNQSVIDQSISCVSYRMFKETNAHYDTLFLNKNFIGDLFILSRNIQEQTFLKAKTDWENGFNKAIIVNGNPLSGKTTFLEQIALKSFKKNSVFLEVNSTISFKGRKFKTANNLEEALLNIKKNLSGERPLLVIDDLELWQDDAHSLLKNTRALLKFIESEANNILVIVSVSSKMQKLLDQRLPFSRGFSTTISTSKSSFEEIYKAVLLRHGASHKVLVNQKKEILSTKQIENQIVKLARDSSYNIGQALQSWTYGTTMIEDNQVLYDNKALPFKDFFSLEEIIVLKFIFLNKKSNELKLKTLVGNRFENTYKSSLKRLTNLKVLLRNQEAQLYINPVLINDIKDILIYRGTLS